MDEVFGFGFGHCIFFPLFHCANSSWSQQNPEVNRAATVKYEKLPQRTQSNCLLMGPARGNEYFGAGRLAAGSLAGSGHLPGSRESRLPDSSGGRDVLVSQGPRRTIPCTTEAAPGCGQGEGAGTRPSCIFIRQATVDPHPSRGSQRGLKSGQAENRQASGAVFAVLRGCSGARRTCSDDLQHRVPSPPWASSPPLATWQDPPRL